MVRPTRFELVTFCFGGKRSIQAELRAHNERVTGYITSLDPLPPQKETYLYTDQFITGRSYLTRVSVVVKFEFSEAYFSQSVLARECVLEGSHHLGTGRTI